MRITGGEFRGRRLEVPKAKVEGFRPTMDFLREVIFSCLANHIDLRGAKVLDVFSGTGVFSFESISRGASIALAIERDRLCCNSIKKNIENFNLKERVLIENKSIEKWQNKGDCFEVVFADPPYESFLFKDLFELLKSQKVFNKNSIFVYEDRARVIYELENYSVNGLGLKLIKMKVHGDSGVAIFKMEQ